MEKSFYNIYRPAELFAFLNSLGIAPKKSLSQNFLLDRNILEKIVKTAEVEEGDFVLEIGPGPGSLTEILLEKKAHVLAVERDDILAKALLRLQTEDNRLTVINEDILQFELPKGKKYKVIANLPYHIATPITTRFAKDWESITSLTLMVQEEVARRMTAEPRTEHFGSLSLYLSFYTDPKYGFKVSRNCFYPKPKVESAIVHFKPKKPIEIEDEEAFFALIRSTFQKRRKQLKSQIPKEILEEAGVNPMSRPEELSLLQFLEIYKVVLKQKS